MRTEQSSIFVERFQDEVSGQRAAILLLAGDEAAINTCSAVSSLKVRSGPPPPATHTGELIEVMPNHRAEPMPMTLFYPHRQYLSPRLQVFTDWLETMLKKHVLQ
ncbi:hypothetical protein MNQ96_01440 [Sphingopyxis granuli]|uniref:hypothetical protein n=1 Tax=Sphingopyxis granuli TaxID=267128 RepID=UPI001F52EEAE|nr:hypothetical protein [Sphingopyxis granuli]UNK79787.1 hypothetical protein MNQ96_01440 [Sphingopyxis granuli]